MPFAGFAGLAVCLDAYFMRQTWDASASLPWIVLLADFCASEVRMEALGSAMGRSLDCCALWDLLRMFMRAACEFLQAHVHPDQAKWFTRVRQE
eukprot:6918404-Alexandrium_andersonii.AAC.1